MRVHSLCWALLLGIITSQAQPDLSNDCSYHLHGQVVYGANHEPAAFAQVYIKELGQVALTDSLGHYTFGGLCIGQYTIQCTHIGGESLETHLHLSADTDQLLQLPDSTFSLDEIVIRGAKKEEETTQVSQHISGIALTQAMGKPLAEVLEQIPGVSRLQTGATIAKPVIHGLHSNRILIVNNGIRQEGQQWGQEHAPEIDPFIAKRLTVLKGANSVRYGSDAIAGVILVDPAALPDSTGIHGEINLVGHQNGRQGITSAIVEGAPTGLPGLSWRIQSTAKRAGDMHTPDYILTNTGVSELNYSGALAFQRERFGIEAFYSRFSTQIGILSAAHIGNLTDLVRAIESPEPLVIEPFSYEINRPYQDIAHTLLKASGYWRPTDSDKLTFTLARQHNLRKEYDKHRARNDSLAALDLPELQFTLNTYTAELLWERSNHEGLTSVSGLSSTYQNNVFSGRSFIPNFVSMAGGVFSTQRYKTGKWEFEGGVRWDYKWINSAYQNLGRIFRNQFNFYSFSATLGAIYAPSKEMTVKLHAGTAWRPPNVNELFSNGVHHGTASVEIGDSTLIPERAWHVIANLNYTPNSFFSGELSLFHNTIHDFIYLRPEAEPTLTIRGAFPTFRYEQINARLIGADAVIQIRPFPRLTWMGKGSYLHAQNTSESQALIFMPANQIENHLRWKWKQIGQLKNAFLAVSLQSVFKQNRVPEEGDYAPPPAGYSLLNAEAGFEAPIGKQVLFVGASVSNLLDTSYRDYLNRFRYYADEPGRNISLRFQFQF